MPTEPEALRLSDREVQHLALIAALKDDGDEGLLDVAGNVHDSDLADVLEMFGDPGLDFGDDFEVEGPDWRAGGNQAFADLLLLAREVLRATDEGRDVPAHVLQALRAVVRRVDRSIKEDESV